jgi:bacterioferritin-associated ferredoxin
MMVCSCNVLTDKDIQSAVMTGAGRRMPTVSQVYASLGCRARCGGCAPTIKKMRETAIYATTMQHANSDTAAGIAGH